MRQFTCSNCDWHEDRHCHFDPPSVQLLMAQGIQGVQPQPVSFHPPVKPEEFCSKHSSLPGGVPSRVVNLN